MNKDFLLSVLILLGIFLGALLGQWLYDPQWSVEAPLHLHQHANILAIFDFLGFDIFMGLLKMLIVPLIAASVLHAVTSLGDIRALGKLGIAALIYYFLTMFFAVVLGLLLVSSIEPGVGLQQEASERLAEAPAKSEMIDSVQQSAAGGLLGVFKNLVSLMIPENIIEAMAGGQTLSIIVFFIFFGVVATLVGEPARGVSQAAEVLTRVLMKMVEIVLWLSPIGVFCLLAWTVARIGLGVFGDSIGVYMLTVLLGLSLHALVLLPLILWLCTRVNPFRYAHQMRAALMMAFGTSSSSATLPVTIESATTEGEVSEEAAGLVLPLGATINMDGTALYEAVAVVFMAQACGIDLSFAQLAIIAVTATLAAVGAAGIPSAGLVTMVIVLEAVNRSLLASTAGAPQIPIEAVGLVIGVDRLLDMVRTTVNVWGDSVGARIVSVMFAGKLPEPVRDAS